VALGGPAAGGRRDVEGFVGGGGGGIVAIE